MLFFQGWRRWKGTCGIRFKQLSHLVFLRNKFSFPLVHYADCSSFIGQFVEIIGQLIESIRNVQMFFLDFSAFLDFFECRADYCVYYCLKEGIQFVWDTNLIKLNKPDKMPMIRLKFTWKTWTKLKVFFDANEIITFHHRWTIFELLIRTSYGVFSSQKQ